MTGDKIEKYLAVIFILYSIYAAYVNWGKPSTLPEECIPTHRGSYCE